MQNELQNVELVKQTNKIINVAIDENCEKQERILKYWFGGYNIVVSYKIVGITIPVAPKGPYFTIRVGFSFQNLKKDPVDNKKLGIKIAKGRLNSNNTLVPIYMGNDIVDKIFNYIGKNYSIEEMEAISVPLKVA